MHIQEVWSVTVLYLNPFDFLTPLQLSVCLSACSFKLAEPKQTAVGQPGLKGLPSSHPNTLVLYTYSNTDSEYERNMHFFVQHGMAEEDGCEYVIIVQQVRTKASAQPRSA